MARIPIAGKEQASPDRCRCREAKTPVGGYLHSMVEIGMMKVLIDHEIFDAIPDDDDNDDDNDGISLRELADKTGAERILLERFSRFLVAARVLSSPSRGRLAHTPVSRTFRDPRAKLLFSHLFDFFLVPAMEWSEYFDAHGLAEPKNASRTPFGLAAGHPDASFYELLETIMPGRAAALGGTLAAAFGAMPVLGVYDFGWVGERASQSQSQSQSRNGGAAAAASSSSSRALIVDVGGGTGHALKAILDDNPRIPPARCVLQDRAGIIREARAEAGDGVLSRVQKVGTDFLSEQPTKGALVYYLRRVLSDWPDEGCVRILGNIRKACAPDSRILVCESLLPDQPSLDVAASDICMMNFGGKWRDEGMFRDISSRSGLRISSIHRDKTSDSAVIEMVPL